MPGEACPLVKGDADGHDPVGSAVKAQSRAGMAATDIQRTGHTSDMTTVEKVVLR